MCFHKGIYSGVNVIASLFDIQYGFALKLSSVNFDHLCLTQIITVLVPYISKGMDIQLLGPVLPLYYVYVNWQ